MVTRNKTINFWEPIKDQIESQYSGFTMMDLVQKTTFHNAVPTLIDLNQQRPPVWRVLVSFRARIEREGVPRSVLVVVTLDHSVEDPKILPSTKTFDGWEISGISIEK